MDIHIYIYIYQPFKNHFYWKDGDGKGIMDYGADNVHILEMHAQHSDLVSHTKAEENMFPFSNT